MLHNHRSRHIFGHYLPTAGPNAWDIRESRLDEDHCSSCAYCAPECACLLNPGGLPLDNYRTTHFYASASNGK